MHAPVSRLPTPDELQLGVRLVQARARDSFRDFRRLMRPNMLWGWWTEDVAAHLQKFYEDLVAGQRPKLGLMAPPQHGKQVSDDTPVLTTRGWRVHGELGVGDEVYAPSGQPVRVSAVSGKTPSRCRVELSNGEVIWCHERHEWTLSRRSRRRMITGMVETRNLVGRRLSEGVPGTRGHRYVYRLPQVAPVEGSPQRLPVAPYALGAWLGDGTRAHPRMVFADGDKKILEAFYELGYAASSINHQDQGDNGVGLTHVNFCIPGHSLRPELSQLGFMNRGCPKFIPDVYLAAPIPDRLELLAGLVDTDGYVNKKGGVVYSTTAPELMATLIRLVSSFGWHASVVAQPIRPDHLIRGRNSETYRQGWHVSFCPTLAIPCRLDRKRVARMPYRRRPVSIRSVTVDLSSHRVGHCITVDSEDGLYLVGDTLQPTHNSYAVTDFIGWVAGKSPDLNTIFGSYSADLGTRANLSLQRMIGHPRYAGVFPNTRIGADGWQCNTEHVEFVGHAGGFRNTTVEGRINGMELNLGVIDDPVKGHREARSKQTRDETWGWFTDDFLSRFDKNAGLLIDMTRWHVDDLLGRAVEKFPDFKVIRYKAIATEDEPHRKKGQSLFPALKPLSFLEERKSTLTQASWESLYQQEPYVAGGGQLPVDKIKVVEGFVRTDVVATCRYVDKAGTEDGDGAYTAAVLMHRMKNRRYLIEHVARGRWGALEREQRIKQLATADYKTYQTYECVVEQEPGSGGKESAENTIRNLAGIPVRADRVTGSKEVRAEPFAAQVQAGNVDILAGPWVYDFIDECEPWPNGRYKDQVDAAAGAFSRLAGRGDLEVWERLGSAA